MILGHICTTEISAKTAFFSPMCRVSFSTSIYRSHMKWPVKRSTAPVRLLTGGAEDAFHAPLASRLLVILPKGPPSCLTKPFFVSTPF